MKRFIFTLCLLATMVVIGYQITSAALSISSGSMSVSSTALSISTVENGVQWDSSSSDYIFWDASGDYILWD